MKRCLRCIALAAVTVFPACVSTAPNLQQVSFAGEWITVVENGISGNKDEDRQSVITDGKRFRIEGKQQITVYDGMNLYTKWKWDPAMANEGGPAAEQPASVTQITPQQATQYMFWARMMGGQAGPGGQVAGRETVLYQARQNLPDRTVTIQYWADSETGVVLKSAESIYAKQVESLLTKTTHDCQAITYAPAQESSFLKP